MITRTMNRLTRHSIRSILLIVILGQAAHGAGFECLTEIDAPRYDVAARWVQLEGNVTVTGVLDAASKLVSPRITVNESVYSESALKLIHLLKDPVREVIEKAQFSSACRGKTIELVFRFVRDLSLPPSDSDRGYISLRPPNLIVIRGGPGPHL
jgi:hypothetical protein